MTSYQSRALSWQVQRAEMLTELLNPLWLTYNMNERFCNTEMVVLGKWRSKTQKFGIKQVDEAQITTVKSFWVLRTTNAQNNIKFKYNYTNMGRDRKSNNHQCIG